METDNWLLSGKKFSSHLKFCSNSKAWTLPISTTVCHVLLLSATENSGRQRQTVAKIGSVLALVKTLLNYKFKVSWPLLTLNFNKS